MFPPRQRVWPRLGLTRNLRITSAFVGLNSFISGQTETVDSGPTCGSGIQSEDSCEMKCEIAKIDDERAARTLPPLFRPETETEHGSYRHSNPRLLQKLDYGFSGRKQSSAYRF